MTIPIPHRLAFAFTVAVLGAPPGLAQESEFPVVLDYVTVAPVQIGERHLVITIDPGTTRIRDRDREIVIDYARLEVRRDEDDDDLPPSVYPLNDPNAPKAAQPSEAIPAPAAAPLSMQPVPGVPIQDQLEAAHARTTQLPPAPRSTVADTVAEALARYEITPASAAGPVRGFPVSAKTLWLGRGFLESRMTGTLHQTLWGRRFSERRVQLWVTTEHRHYRTLAALMAERAPILRANPMLAQVDWTVLIPELGGLPVRLDERGKDLLMRVELQTD
ncbi:MAG: hypothetical protein EOM91_16730 [Sphingobacteriia bacterium]|jgi:hypothetical protein|nr:hypothetical protein [Sphingobacteriia bacterium]